MEEEEKLLEVSIVSEKTGTSIGVGFELNDNWMLKDILEKDIESNLAESFYEMCREFYELADIAIKKKEISGYSKEDLFKVFGHFSLSTFINDEDVNLNLGIDPDEYMYFLLVEYAPQ